VKGRKLRSCGRIWSLKLCVSITLRKILKNMKKGGGRTKIYKIHVFPNLSYKKINDI
jgi:hypothetical protein